MRPIDCGSETWGPLTVLRMPGFTLGVNESANQLATQHGLIRQSSSNSGQFDDFTVMR